MPLLPLDATGADWLDIPELVRSELRARVSVIIPGEPGEYTADGAVGEGTSDTPLITARRARVRPRSTPSTTNSADDYRKVQFWRITIENEAGDPEIPDEGAILVVEHGGYNARITGQRWAVLGAKSSSESPFTFIDCKASS